MEKQPEIDQGGGIHFPWASFYPSGVVHTWDERGIGGQNWDATFYDDTDKFTEALVRTEYKNPCPLGVPGDRLFLKERWAARGTHTDSAPEIDIHTNLLHYEIWRHSQCYDGGRARFNLDFLGRWRAAETIRQQNDLRR